MKYDILTTKQEIELSKEEINQAEEKCSKFNFSTIRTKQNFYNKCFYKILRVIAPVIFNIKNISHHSKVLSERTTGHYSEYRFFHLFKRIIQIQPKLIVEYGSGASTVFIAEILRYIENTKQKAGKIISFEQSEKYYDLVQANFPDELREYVEINLVPVQYKRYGNYRGLSYKIDKYPSSVDLAYIDGPTMTRGDQNKLKFWIMSDIIELINNGCDLKFSLTDKRFTNYLTYKELIGDKYYIKLDKQYRSIEIEKR
tara:strand:+ start:367 stop:1134 length:768 start_codon:yes stop_codon:yes gene_type:complete